MAQRSSVHSLLLVLSKINVLMHGNVLNATLRMGFIRFRELSFISTTVLWHMLTSSESIFLSRLYINSLEIFWISLMIYRISMLPFIKESVSIHRLIIYTGLKISPQCSSQSRWWYVLSSMHEYTSDKKPIQTIMESSTWWSVYNSEIWENHNGSCHLHQYILW